jgi:hypothetical protein
MSRTLAACVVCGDPRVQIVSKGRCAKCLMKERREAERRGEAVHNPAEHTYLKELNGYLSRFVKAAAALEDAAVPDTFISAEDLNTVRRIIREGIDRVQAAKRGTEHHDAVKELRNERYDQQLADDDKKVNPLTFPSELTR